MNNIATNIVKKSENKLHKGVIFHWGIYSVPAFDDIKSARRRRLKNGSEWYLKRLKENGNYHPISGYKETQRYHAKNYKNVNYFYFLDEFNEQAQEWDPQAWFDILKNANIEYAILTAKHHDGVCLWNTKTTDSKTDRDLVKDFIRCGRKNGISVGLYYSWTEFFTPATKQYMDNIVKVQIMELRDYNPDIFWFDGDWDLKSQYSKNMVHNIAINIKNSDILVNSRLGEDGNGLGTASFKVFGDRIMPNADPGCMWEYIFTIGLSWGLNLKQKKSDYLTGRDMYELYEKVYNMNGSFLINFGPYPNGNLDKNELKSFNDFINTI